MLPREPLRFPTHVLRAALLHPLRAHSSAHAPVAPRHADTLLPPAWLPPACCPIRALRSNASPFSVGAAADGATDRRSSAGALSPETWLQFAPRQSASLTRASPARPYVPITAGNAGRGRRLPRALLEQTDAAEHAGWKCTSGAGQHGVLVKSSMHSGTIRVTAGNGRATWSTTRSVAPPVPPGDDHTYIMSEIPAQIRFVVRLGGGRRGAATCACKAMGHSACLGEWAETVWSYVWAR